MGPSLKYFSLEKYAWVPQGPIKDSHKSDKTKESFKALDGIERSAAENNVEDVVLSDVVQ